MSPQSGTYSHKIGTRSGLPIYVDDRIPLRSYYVFLVALSILRGIFKNTASGDWYVCPVDLVGSLRAQHRTDMIFVCWSCRVMDAVHESCIEYLWIFSGCCVVRLGWIFDG